MKYIYLVNIIVLMVSCGNRRNTTNYESLLTLEQSEHPEKSHYSTPRVYVTYNQIVNGYKVNIIWFPWNGASEVGDAFINFVHQSGTPKFTIASSHYTSLDTRILADSAGTFTDGQKFLLDYNPPRIDRFFDGHSPFFFRDIDFDGKDELLITEWQGGAKGSSKYDAYKIYDYHAEKLTRKPFDYITDSDIYDYDAKTITQWLTDGAYYTTKLVYGYHKTEYNSLSYLEEEILDDFYFSIKLDSLVIYEGDNVSVYARQMDKLNLINKYSE